MEEKKRTKAEYRSSLRSKKLIREALVRLMKEKPFEKITITDIVKEADINRGTFYAHFKDSGDVLESIREHIISELKSAFEGMTPDIALANPRPLLESVTEFIARDREYYRMMISIDRIRPLLLDCKYQAIDYLMTSTLAERIGQDDARKSRMVAFIDFIISASFDIYYDILSDKIPMTLEEAPEMLTRAIGMIVRPLSESIR